MSDCHEPEKKVNDLLIEFIGNCHKSFENLEKMIKINEQGLNKCFEWAEKISERLAIMEKWNASHCKIGLDCEEKIRNLESYYDLKRDTRKDLNASLSAIQDDYKNKIEKLEAHISKVHDLVNLEDRITASDVLNRLTLLETHKNYQTDENRKVSKRIDEICKNFDENRVLIHREPHRCPICEGKGKYQSLQSNPPYVLHNSCEKCEGKGVLWG